MTKYIKKTNNPKMGAPKKEIDWDIVKKLCEIHCTAEEIASFTGISEDTYLRSCKELYNQTFAEFIKEKSAGGKASLRRLQWKAAEKGNPTMLIWLGKQVLDQKDKADITSDNEKIEIIINNGFLPKLDNEE